MNDQSRPGRPDHPTTVPAPAPAHRSPAATAGDDEAPAPDRPRLLLIEKDEAMSVVLTKTLSAYHEVETVTDGLSAAFTARANPPDLAIVDLYLPGTDNLTLIRSMRADPRTAGTPILILSAPTSREMLLRCLSAGASNFLLKPFNLAELLMCVRIELRLRDPLTEALTAPPALP